MPLLCVIPARIGSTRLPQKPLRTIAGTPLISLVTQRVLSLDLGCRIVVATDSAAIAEVVEDLDVECVMTAPGHRSGTERIAEVLRRPAYADADVVLNIQGDEPFVPAAAVSGALERVTRGDPIGTAAAPLAPERAADPNRVKVALDDHGHAVGFSRSPLSSGLARGARYLQHIGVYAYTRGALLQWVATPAVPEERAERLEQLRPLALGTRIGVALLSEEAPAGIDTEEDLRNAENYLQGQREVNA